jgi:hypothetical protein
VNKLTDPEPGETSRPEAAFVLLLMQAMFWVIAGLSSIPLAFGGEIFMLALGTATVLFGLFTAVMGIGLLWRRRYARRLVIGLEVACAVGSLLLLALPIGANHGPVSWLSNVLLPVAVILLLRGRKMRAVFSTAR